MKTIRQRKLNILILTIAIILSFTATAFADEKETPISPKNEDLQKGEVVIIQGGSGPTVIDFDIEELPISEESIEKEEEKSVEKVIEVDISNPPADEKTPDEIGILEDAPTEAQELPHIAVGMDETSKEEQDEKPSVLKYILVGAIAFAVAVVIFIVFNRKSK